MGKVEYVIDDGIATVTFTNPPKGFFTLRTQLVGATPNLYL